jgi:hypothetical protein
LERLRQHDEATAASNGRMLTELWALTSRLAADRVPALVLKGPVLALWGIGLQARVFHDLDLLVRPADMARAGAALKSTGFVELQTGNHDYHRVYAKTAARPAIVLELHFGMVDRERRYVPDLEGLWDRAVCVSILDHPCHTVSVTDHLLLAILQLPHHHWDLRLAVDIGHVVARHTATIDWDGFMERARAWGMRVLAGSTLGAAAAMWNLALPDRVAQFAEPETSVQKVQWHLVREALSEQLGLDGARLGRTAQFLILDRPSEAFAAAIARSLMQRDGTKSLSGIARRLRTGIAGVPALLAALSGTARRSPKAFH